MMSEQKVSPDNIKQARKTLFKGREAGTQSELSSTEIKSRMILRLGEEECRPCAFVNSF